MKRSQINRGTSQLKRTAFMSKPKPMGSSKRSREKTADRLKREKHWRRVILDRDHMTCRLCGIKAITVEELDAHHIAMRSQRPDLKYCIYNGAALHRKCHDWVHANPKESTALGLLSDVPYERRIDFATTPHGQRLDLHGE